MKGFNIAEGGHFVNVVPPKDITGGVTGDRFSMKNFQHASIIVQIGVSAAAPTAILVYSAAAASGGSPTAIPFRYYSETTAAGDTVSAKADATASGITSLSANDGVFYIIEIDSAELEEDEPWVEVVITNTTNSVIASIGAVLSGARYAGSAGLGITAIA